MAHNKQYRFLDLSGYAFTGKHAVIDLMREIRGYQVPRFDFEFNLLRIQGGIRDLETALVDDWSPVRSDAAIRRFKRLIKRHAQRNKIFSPRTWFQAVGWDYEGFYKNQFTRLSEEYIKGLVTATWSTAWPFPLADLSPGELFWRKFKNKVLRISTANDFEVSLSAPKNFLEHTRTYLNNLLTMNLPNDIHTVVMHNAFEPFNPERSLRYFHSAKSIIVDRDPRDNYVAGLSFRPTAVPTPEFIRRYQLYRDVSRRYPKDPANVLQINFEDLVLQYESMVPKILRFLGEKVEAHVHPKLNFDPAVSAKNIGIWKTYEKQEEIELITRELKEYLHE